MWQDLDSRAKTGLIGFALLVGGIVLGLIENAATGTYIVGEVLGSLGLLVLIQGFRMRPG